MIKNSFSGDIQAKCSNQNPEPSFLTGPSCVYMRVPGMIVFEVVMTHVFGLRNSAISWRMRVA